MASSPPFITIRSLRKHYTEGDQQRIIFADLTLDIGRGEFVALLGPSGSGKSTLLNLLGGIDLPDAGQIRVSDRMLTTLPEVERTRFRRRHIGFVFQFFNLIPTLTVEENLLLPLELNGLTLPEQRDRALVHGPWLLLADEPTGNLDAATGERILELLLTLHRQAETTMIMVTHSQAVAARADRILALEAGQIQELAR